MSRGLAVITVLTNTALVALLAGSIGIAGLVPSYAAPAAASQWTMGHDHHFGPHRLGMRDGQRAGLGATLMRIACTDRDTEALEIAFVRAKYELELNATQAPLLDALRTAALANQKSFEATCKTALGDRSATRPATLLDRLQARLTLSQAKVTALQDTLPKFKAFYDSLSTDQQAQLSAHAGWRGRGKGMQRRDGAAMAPMTPDTTPPDGSMQPDSTVPAAPPTTPGKTEAPAST